MWPWGHAAVGYLVYSIGVRLDGRRVSGLAVIALAVGTQFPDLIDKPLGWTFGVLPGGRTLAHSLLTVAVVAAIAGTLARRVQRQRVTAAFLCGYVSHLFADGLYSLVEGEYANLSYLLWPIFPAPEPEIAKSFLAHFANLTVDPFFAFEGLLVCLAAIVWVRDGYPGVSDVATWLSFAKQKIVSSGRS